MTFPSSPNNNQRVIVNDIIYIYESASNAWKKVKATTANVVVTNSANIVSGTASTSTTTGALRVAGGAGITGNVVAGAVYTNSYFYANGTPYANTGFTGSAGTGFTGSAGFTGSVGSAGFTGSAGVNGFTGSVGGTGFTGSAGGSAVYSRTSITATAGQTVFTVAYTVGYLEVFFNGALLNSVDYTASNGTTVVLTDPAAVGDIVEFVAYAMMPVANVSTATFNSTNITSNLAITAGYSAVSVGPLTIAANVVISIANGQKWVIL